jgi:hypothetical protein
MDKEATERERESLCMEVKLLDAIYAIIQDRQQKAAAGTGRL